MPSVKLVAEKLFEDGGVRGWSAAHQLEELRGKVHLKGKDKDAYKDGTDVEKKLYEAAILQYRQHNKTLRKEVKARENGNEYVIQSALKDDKECKLSVARLTAERTIVELDQRACEAARHLDLCRYERLTREEELEKLKWDLEHLNDLEEQCPEDISAEQDVIRLENAMDKVDIKLNTARILSNKYHEIITRLKSDSLSLPPKLDAMEAALIHTKSDIKDLRHMAEESYILRDKANEQLQLMQQETLQARTNRMNVLEKTKEDVARRKEDLQTKERTLRAPRPTLVGESADFRAAAELQKTQQTQKKILALESSFSQIKEVTHANDIEGVISRVVKQSDTKKDLKKQVQQLENQLTRLLEEHDSLHQKFRDMKYSGEQTLSRGQTTIAQLQDMLNKCDKENSTVRESLKNNGECLVEVKQAIITLLGKLNEIKLPSPEHSYPRGDVLDQLDLSVKKLERLMKEVGATAGDASLKEKLQNPDFQEFLLKRVGSDNIRVKLQPSKAGMHDFDTEQSNEGALSRVDVKMQGQRLMDSKIKPKKKKQSNRKK